jgi:uncharacterized paraquat-inducible protein A
MNPTRHHGIARCKPCKMAFAWPKGKPKLRDALCPRCGEPLSQTTLLLQGVVWTEETPKTRTT